MKDTDLTSVGIAGLGAIGGPVAEQLLAEGLPGYKLVAVSAKNKTQAREKLTALGGADVELVGLSRLADVADIVIECVPAEHFDEVAVAAVESGRTLIPMSVGALASRTELIERARQTGACIVVPSGAMLGLDALSALAEGTIRTVSIKTSKPPKALHGAPYLKDRNIDVLEIDEAIRVFKGNARAAAKAFPASVNVTALIALAGIGLDSTAVEVWADPALQRNTHRVEVLSDSSDFTFTIENRPSPLNPRTGIITAQSVIAALRRRKSHLQIGT